jgi:hypothetical protein
MKVEWVALADGVGQDTRGAVTAIALSQNVFPAPTLPAVTKRAVVIHITAEPGTLKPGESFGVTFNVCDPHGRVINAQSGQVVVGPTAWPDLPVVADVPAEMLVNVTEYGAYRIEVTIRPNVGEEIVRSVEFYATDPSLAAEVIPPPIFGVRLAE